MKECIVLKASAGTGKTYRLSLEYIRALLKGENYRDILVMTFTKKATGEIKERILSFLEKISKGEGEDILENISKLDGNLNFDREKIEKIYREVSINRDRLKIYTIDSFINSIFKNVIAPYLNILSYEIIDDGENEEVLRKTFEKIIENKKEFSRFKKFFEKNTERNIDVYLESIKNLIYDRWKMLLIESQIDKVERKTTLPEIGELKSHMDHILRIIEEIKIRKKKGDPSEDFFKSAYKKYFTLGEDKKEEFFLENWNVFLKDDKCWNGNKTKSTKAMDISDLVSEMEDVNEELKKDLAIKIYNRDVIEYENEILSFISNLYSIYDEIKFTEKRFTHNDISSYTFKYINDSEINLIDENGVTDYFLEIFEGNIKTLFIDEFQDTSILQWKILNGIIKRSEWVICVGDEKQSIYGWRGGEKTLFEKLDGILNGKVESLSTSYRSKQSIVKFTNDIFNSISKSYDEDYGELDLQWSFTEVDGKSKELGYVEIIEPTLDDEEEEFEVGKVLVEDIENKFQGDYRDVAVIARTNRELNNISRILSEKKIPFVLDSSESIVDHRAIEGIFKLLKYLVRKDFFSLLEFLRSDLVNISNETMKKIIENKYEIEMFFKDEGEEEIIFLNVFSKIKNYMKELERKNHLQFLLGKIIKEFGVIEIYKTKSDLKNINSFIELGRTYDNLYEMVKDLEENGQLSKFKQVSLEEKNAVILMTIHKSKGLEYETVYYYHRALPTRGGSGLQFHIELSQDYETVENYIFIDKKYEKLMGYIDEKYKYIDEKAYKDRQEEINALYVVLTRAKNNLILVLDKKVDGYLKVAMENFGEITLGNFKRENKNEILEERENPLRDINFQEPTYDLEILNRNLERMMETHRQFNLEAESKRLIGTAVHYYLENIIYDTEEGRTYAFKRAMSKYGTLIGEERLYTILKSQELSNFMVENKLIFSRDWDYIYPEYEVYSEDLGELRRIDRIMIKKPQDDMMGKVLIIDYKTGGKDQSQINDYVHLIENQLRDIGEYENYNVKGEFMEIKLPEIKL
ncbi:UvrD-helicase domain-containing protein [Cetobacterium sp. SF1]|uniref:UvrD-helicase domain-containing protein n=1 Tax=Cetobacterium sp. SF1 TaxID=3417654 RepID=UPI003CEF44CE